MEGDPEFIDPICTWLTGSHWVVDTCYLTVVYQSVTQTDIWALVDLCLRCRHAVLGRPITDKYLENLVSFCCSFSTNFSLNCTAIHGCNLCLRPKFGLYRKFPVRLPARRSCYEDTECTPFFYWLIYSAKQTERCVWFCSHKALGWLFGLSLYILIIKFVPKNQRQDLVRGAKISSLLPVTQVMKQCQLNEQPFLPNPYHEPWWEDASSIWEQSLNKPKNRMPNKKY